MKLYFKNFVLLCLILLQISLVAAEESECEMEAESDENKSLALRLKIGAIFAIVFASFVGVMIPIIGQSYPWLQPESNLFYILKAFAGGVLLAVGLIHILPESFERLGSPCLPEKPWHLFNFAGFIAMLSAILTLMVDSFATGYLNRPNPNLNRAVVGIPNNNNDQEALNAPQELNRYRVIAQVLELGIVIHSIIIGIATGTSQSPSTIRPLIAALSFHQFFEGIGLGGCIVQARLRLSSTAMMALFFTITTSLGIIIGIGIASSYNGNNVTTLIVEGVLDSAAAGILIYMALVDLLAADFMSEKVQNSRTLQIGVNISVLLGAAGMSIIAKWA
ncbi:Zinc transporter 5 [Zostera marina]|uniref:Zinc transporter 5 n=1 Tax=Zostera marina TaxID=29655 RepID=A0A0K9PW33_ZOSMR|nr:Zinc transporter 5 [Zostera marina]